MMRTLNILPLFTLLFVLCGHIFIFTQIEAGETKVYIAYLGERQHDDPDEVQDSHHEILATVVGSKEAAADLMVHNYKHGFSGFAAKLTLDQAKKLSEMPEIIRVLPSQIRKAHTTRSWDLLNMPFDRKHDNNLLHKANMGDGIIIGVIDTGIWPEHDSFSEEGLGPVPSRWKGVCGTGYKFNLTNCNKKIIGARYYIDGFLEEFKKLSVSEKMNYLSPRDANGHGTHCASTAAGAIVHNASYNGLESGTIRGGAPRARLAIYKVGWSWGKDLVMGDSDVLKAIDDAIHDGVDIISASIGRSPDFAYVDDHEWLGVGAYHAVTKGITVVASAGNDGPKGGTVLNTEPWVLTVGACTLDRENIMQIELGNNQTLLGRSLYTENDTKYLPLGYPMDYAIYGEEPQNYTEWFEGKVVMLYHNTVDMLKVFNATLEGHTGIIYASDIPFGQTNKGCVLHEPLPCVEVDKVVGSQILAHIRYTKSPTVKFSPAKTFVGVPYSPTLAAFSGRGPSPVSPEILKPDITAPGEEILAATNTDGYALESGTSMAAPQVAGIVALLKVLHPDWSPSAIKSALITTAWGNGADRSAPIFSDGSPVKRADPFDFGGGIVNPNRAAYPGLIYDMTPTDYIHYACILGKANPAYNSSAITYLSKKAFTACPSKLPSILDLNLPSITIPFLKNSVTVTRTVTNVGAPNSNYKLDVESPLGINVSVKPDTLVFNPSTKSTTYTVTFTTEHKRNTGFYFGSLTWNDGKHNVRIPLSVRTEISNYHF